MCAGQWTETDLLANASLYLIPKYIDIYFMIFDIFGHFVIVQAIT